MVWPQSRQKKKTPLQWTLTPTPIVVVAEVGHEGLLSVALETCASRADLAPEQFHVHLVAHGAFLRSGEGVNLRREVLAEETKSLGLAPHRCVYCATIHTSSATPALFSSYHVVSEFGHCSITCAIIRRRVRETDHQEDVCAGSLEMQRQNLR